MHKNISSRGEEDREDANKNTKNNDFLANQRKNVFNFPDNQKDQNKKRKRKKRKMVNLQKKKKDKW